MERNPEQKGRDLPLMEEGQRMQEKMGSRKWTERFITIRVRQVSVVERCC